MTITKQLDWKEILKERIKNYDKEITVISRALNTMVNELKITLSDIRIEVKLHENVEKLAWEVKLGKHSQFFYLHDFKLGLHNSGKPIDDLNERIQVAFLEKFKIDLK